LDWYPLTVTTDGDQLNVTQQEFQSPDGDSLDWYHVAVPLDLAMKDVSVP
jgi:hypothetical protein